jgi:hypothetical protein
MIRRRHVPPSVSLAEISPEVAKLSRRRLLRNGLSLGSLALLRKPFWRLILKSSRSPPNGEPRCGCEFR